MLFIWLLLVSCLPAEAPEESPASVGGGGISEVLGSSYFTPVDSHTFLSIHGDTAYTFFRDIPENKTREWFLKFQTSETNDKVHFRITEDHFDPDLGLYVIRHAVPGIQDGCLIVGSVIEAGNKAPETRELISADGREVLKRDRIYRNELMAHLGKDLVSERFEADLKEGRYFEVPGEYRVLLAKEAMYFLWPVSEPEPDKIFLHFLQSDREFLDGDFYVKDREITDQLKNGGIPGFRVARVILPLPPEEVGLMRFGVLKDGEKQWAKVITVGEVLQNELLKYHYEE